MEPCFLKKRTTYPVFSWIPKVTLNPPFPGKKFLKPSIRALSLSLLVSGLMMATSYAQETVLQGTLTIDFNTPQNEISPPLLNSELKITIPPQRHMAGVEIPKHVDGQPFRGQEFTVTLVPNGCVLDGGPNNGQAFLRLAQKHRRQPVKGTAFKTMVSNGQYECLFGGASQVLPYDPFDSNHQTSVIGELVIWWTQILASINPNNNQSVQEELYQFFEIQGAQGTDHLNFRDVEYPGTSSPGCTLGSSHLHCNRGGSATGVLNADIRVTFQEHVLQ